MKPMPLIALLACFPSPLLARPAPYRVGDTVASFALREVGGTLTSVKPHQARLTILVFSASY